LSASIWSALVGGVSGSPATFRVHLPAAGKAASPLSTHRIMLLLLLLLCSFLWSVWSF